MTILKMLTGDEIVAGKELTELQKFYRTKGNPPPLMTGKEWFANNPYGREYKRKKK